MSDATSLTSGVAGRYATALFEIAQEAKNLEAVEADLDALSNALQQSADLRDVISLPVFSRAEQAGAMAAVAREINLGHELSNTIALMASKRRLAVLPAVIAAVKALAAEARGEVTAEVTAAKALTEAQQKKLAKALKASVGKNVTIDMSVDESLIGGLIVKMGSKMIDTSVATKLSNLQTAMKEVG